MNSQKMMLNRFYAVTQSSIYEVKDSDEGLSPSIKKIVSKGESVIKVGERLSCCSAELVSIGKQIIAFIPEGGGYSSYQRQIGLVNTRYWGAQTSAVVALFLTKKEAENCWKTDNLKTCDDRWIEQTKAILTGIGEDHPLFTISHTKGLALIS